MKIVKYTRKQGLRAISETFATMAQMQGEELIKVVVEAGDDWDLAVHAHYRRYNGGELVDSYAYKFGELTWKQLTTLSDDEVA